MNQSDPKKILVTFSGNTEGRFILVDEDGVQNYVPVAVTGIDRTAPQANLYYSEINPTANEIQVSVVNPNEQITFLNNNGTGVYTFTGNGSFQFSFADKAGNI